MKNDTEDVLRYATASINPLTCIIILAVGVSIPQAIDTERERLQSSCAPSPAPYIPVYDPNCRLTRCLPSHCLYALARWTIAEGREARPPVPLEVR
jgi:hypothetical protein